jgi:hypothetical protein
MNQFFQRLLRAARLDVKLYEEVEADKSLLSQAMLVVVLSSIAGGIGTVGISIWGLFFGSLAALAGWFIWAYMTYFIGTRLFPEPQTHADHGQLLRTLGFASAPGLVRVIGVIGGIRELVLFAASIWMLIAMVIAVRQALDYKSTLRAVGVCCVGWIVQLLILAILLGLAGKGAGAF